MTKRCIWFAAAMLVVSLMPTLCFGQAVFGSIFGTVTDPQGAAVAGATVTVTNVGKGTTDTATTNDSGNYSVTHLIPDTYSVKVESSGFKAFEQKSVLVTADASKHVDAQLQVGSASETLEVTAEVPQLQTDRADVAITFNERYVRDLPILNRNFTTFQLLSPGTQKLAGWNHAATENPQGGQQIMVQGQHFSGTGFQLDGTDNQDPILGIIVINPNLDAITETKVGNQNYDAEMGKAVAGLVTAQTKSGTNDFHGTGFWFRRTDANLARDPFTQFAKNATTGRFIPSDRWNQYGGTFGGPIIKNKLFFFGDYQGTKETTGVTNNLTVPTSLVLSTCTQAVGMCNLSEYLHNPTINGGGQVYQPNLNNAPGFKGATAVNGNLIPVGDLSQQAVNVLKLFPQPTTGGVKNNYIASGAGSFKQNAFDTRIDYTLNQSNTIFGRFSLAYFTLSGNPSLGALGGIGFGPGPGLAGTSNVHNYSLATGWTHTFSPSLLMDVRFGWFKYNPQTEFWDQGQNPMTAFGIPGLNMGNFATSGLSYFNLGGNNQTGNNGPSDFGNGLGVQRCNCPLTERENQYQWVANITKIHGNHTIKFGGDFRYATNLRVPSDQNRAGQLQFDQNGTSNGGSGGLNLATFLYGDVTQFQRYASTSLNATEHQYRFFVYGQDTWRVTPKLTLSYGLRWELYTPEAVNGAQNGGFANIIQGQIRVAGVGPFGLNGNINNQFNDFAPRFGFAYQLYDKTVIRAGFGVSYDIGVFGSNFGHTVTQNLPVLVAQQTTFCTLNPLVPNCSNGYAPAFTLGPGGFTSTLPGLMNEPPAPNFGTPVPSTGVLPLQGPTGQVSPRVRPLSQVVPYIYAYNLTVQQQLDRATTLTLSYVGNLGRHGFVGDGPNYNVNQQDLNGVRPLAGRFTYPGYTLPNGSVLTCCTSDIGNYFGNDANANYNALQAVLERQMTNGLQIITHFTWSRALHYDSNYYVNVPRVAYGPYDQNRTLVWVLNWVYDLPFGHGKKYASNVSGAWNYVIGGWQWTGTTNWSSGLPWTPTLNNCSSEIDGSSPCRPDKGLGQFSTGTSGLIHPAGGGSPVVRFFTPTVVGGAFLNPGPGRIGNVGFGSYWGPKAFTTDMSIAKNFQLTERFRLQFRMNAYNIFNHPALNFSNTQSGGGTCVASSGPTGTCGSSNGTIQDILFGTTMRQLEFGLHLFF